MSSTSKPIVISKSLPLLVAVPAAVEEKKKEQKELYTFIEEEESDTSSVVTLPSLKVVPLLRASLMSGARSYRTHIGLVGVITTAGTGAINSTIQNSSLAAVAEFVAFATVFDEFFIHGFSAEYKPFNQFQTNPSASLSSALYSSGPIYGAPLYHGAATYASATAMASNVDVKMLSTAFPWSMSWRNNEKSTSTVSTSASTSAPTATQSWALTSATSAALYQGLLQFRTLTNLANILSTTVGEVLIKWDVTFRARA